MQRCTCKTARHAYPQMQLPSASWCFHTHEHLSCQPCGALNKAGNIKQVPAYRSPHQSSRTRYTVPCCRYLSKSCRSCSIRRPNRCTPFGTCKASAAGVVGASTALARLHRRCTFAGGCIRRKRRAPRAGSHGGVTGAYQGGTEQGPQEGVLPRVTWTLHAYLEKCIGSESCCRWRLCLSLHMPVSGADADWGRLGRRCETLSPCSLLIAAHCTLLPKAPDVCQQL